MKRCPHCMNNLIGSVCPVCGRKPTAETRSGCLPIGTLLNNQYELGNVLGQGGFGITYIAWDRKRQRKVAIKEYFPNRCTSPFRKNKISVCAMNGFEQIYAKGMQNFAHEGHTLAQITHIPEVVHILDCFNANNTAYIVMEYIEGKSLEQIIKEKGKLSVSEMTTLFTPLIKVMEQLHQMNITHRDISPDNIICMPDGKLKLIDFGAARQIENGKSVTVTLKPGFSPPEQYTTRGQGAFTDVYALTATIYYCLTGAIPHTSPERLENDTMKSPRELGANLTEEQDAVLLWGMTVQPKERPANMTVFARRFYEVFPLHEPQPEPVVDDVIITSPNIHKGTEDPDKGGTTIPGKTVNDDNKTHVISESVNPYDVPKKKETKIVLPIIGTVVSCWLFGILIGALFSWGIYEIFKKDSKISTKGAKIIVAVALFIVCFIVSTILGILIS